jgi:DNA-directed RNA polymerase specialized sigma24 family protein
MDRFVDFQAPADWVPSAPDHGLDPEEVLDRVGKHLDPVDAEVFWLVQVKGKTTHEAAELLGMRQSTLWRRLDRLLAKKLPYLVIVDLVDVEELVTKMADFMTEEQRAVLVRLAYTLNASLSGRPFGRTQATVAAWLRKATRKVEERERKDPEEWGPLLGLLYLVKRHLGYGSFIR